MGRGGAFFLRPTNECKTHLHTTLTSCSVPRQVSWYPSSLRPLVSPRYLGRDARSSSGTVLVASAGTIRTAPKTRCFGHMKEGQLHAEMGVRQSDNVPLAAALLKQFPIIKMLLRFSVCLKFDVGKEGPLEYLTWRDDRAVPFPKSHH